MDLPPHGSLLREFLALMGRIEADFTRRWDVARLPDKLGTSGDVGRLHDPLGTPGQDPHAHGRRRRV